MNEKITVHVDEDSVEISEAGERSILAFVAEWSVGGKVQEVIVTSARGFESVNVYPSTVMDIIPLEELPETVVAQFREIVNSRFRVFDDAKVIQLGPRLKRDED